MTDYSPFSMHPRRPSKNRWVVMTALMLPCLLAVSSCGGSSFKGSGGVRKASVGRTGLDASSQSLPGSQIPPSFSDGGRATLANRFNDFLFAGSGPGSCGLPVKNNPCRPQNPPSVTIPLRCPKEYAEIGSVGDCFMLPQADALEYKIPMQCNGNRPLCQKTGQEDPNVVIEVRMTNGSACPDGFNVDASGSNVLGVVSSPGACTNYSTSAFCKKTVPLTSLPPGSAIVSAIAITGTNDHLASPPGCPYPFEDVGTAPDCSNYNKNKSFECCSGRIRFCQKKDVVK